MIGRVMRWITHRDRRETTAKTIHAMRNRAQVAEAEKALIVKAREQGDLMWLESALTRRSTRREGEPS